MIAGFQRHPDLKTILLFAVTVPAAELEPASMLRFGQMLYAFWQYAGAYLVLDAGQPVQTQRDVARAMTQFCDHAVVLRRLYPLAIGNMRMSLTQDAQTQLANILSRDPIQPFDFDLPNACLRIVAGTTFS